MKKKRTSFPLPPREQFLARYLRKLQSFSSKDPIIALILKDKNRRDQCANLFWNCVNDAPARLAGISNRRHDFWASQLETAIRGAEAIALIYQESGDSRIPQFMGQVRNDLVEKQRHLSPAFPTAQARGRGGRDWSVLLYAQRMLEGHLDGERISDSTLATLLDVAEEVARTGKTATKNAVRQALPRLRERLPIVEDTLTKFYPRGEKFPPPASSQLARK